MIIPRSDRRTGRRPRPGPLFFTFALVAALLPAGPAQAQSPCSVDYRVTNDWGSGFTAEVTLTNDAADLPQWSLVWEFTSGQQVTNAWNAEVVQDNGSVTASGPDRAPGLAGGASATFGFQTTHTGGPAVPDGFSLGGHSCTTR
ncbi:cellulose binding domain-containing protein [Nocardiopsis terrae]